MHFSIPLIRGVDEATAGTVCMYWRLLVDHPSPYPSLSTAAYAQTGNLQHASPGNAGLLPAGTGVRVLGPRIDAVTWDDAMERIGIWAARRESRYLVACNVHSVVTARRDNDLLSAINGADLAVADGAPVAWLMRKQGCVGQERIGGPDLMWRYFEQAAVRGESVFLYGSTPETLARLVQRIEATFAGLRIAGTCSPPFRALAPEEDDAIVRQINASGANTVWVALGCPKQEVWMAEHRDRIRAPLIGVGAAFAFHAGTARRAPKWMQRHGLEWAHRLICEPRRLAKRYLVTNTLFLWGVVGLLLQGR